MTAGSEVAAALRALAAAARATGSTRAALARWHEDAPERFREPLTDLARRLRLGADPVRAAASLEPYLGPIGARVAAAIRASLETGADLARLAGELARVAELELARAQAAAAATAGARSSTRLIAGLAASSIAMAVVVRPPVADAAGLAVASLGTVLILIGIAWVRRLAPTDLRDDGLSQVADMTAAMMRAGAQASVALDIILAHPPEPLAGPLAGARRRVRLGITWPEALARSRDPGLHALGAVLERHRRLGHAVATELGDLAAYLRAEQDRTFEAATRRAAVAMIVPLAICLLPGFVLLGLVPFLRGLSTTA